MCCEDIERLKKAIVELQILADKSIIAMAAQQGLLMYLVEQLDEKKKAEAHARADETCTEIKEQQSGTSWDPL